MDMVRTAFNYALGGVLGITIAAAGIVLTVAMVGHIAIWLAERWGE